MSATHDAVGARLSGAGQRYTSKRRALVDALLSAGNPVAIADLADRTRNNKIGPDELSGGTFTLTNTGSRGALFDTPVVFLPQVAILGTGIVTKKPAVVMVDGQEAIAVRSMVYLALSYDHRIVDGADAARFLTAVKERLEEADRNIRAVFMQQAILRKTAELLEDVREVLEQKRHAISAI